MHFLITAGGTREYIDPVRFISNSSSGKMGYALARAAREAGHEVSLLSANVALESPAEVEVISVETTEQMFDAVKEYFSGCDCLIMAAAVADWTPKSKAPSKIKKSTKEITIKLKPTPDILSWAGENKKKSQIVVGFALEDRRLRKKAEAKLERKGLDIIVADKPATIGKERATFHIKSRPSGWVKMEDVSKTVLAKTIIKMAESF